MSPPRILDALSRLASEARELLGTEVVRLPRPPSPLEFLRIVTANKPVVFQHVADDWDALRNWRDSDYLDRLLGEGEVTVAVTPNGWADAVVDGRFVLPYEESMSFSNLLRKFVTANDERDATKEWQAGEAAPGGPVYYVQSQNNNLHKEFAELLQDVPAHIGFATEALDREPDAVNFWMGDSRATTSLHKDHYENLYLVIAGVKTFTL
ncbi:JmjC domain-containing protein 7 [Borealophlyctis nickersoniae]|nr:JmjC domain-containing protein 7 [Borealophlyctis nickersoniae]